MRISIRPISYEVEPTAVACKELGKKLYMNRTFEEKVL